MIGSKPAELCSGLHGPSVRTLPSPHKDPVPVCSTSHPPAPGKHESTSFSGHFLQMGSHGRWTSAPGFSHLVFEAHTCHSADGGSFPVLPDGVPLCGWHRLCLLRPLTRWLLFPLLDCYELCWWSICPQDSVWTYVLISFGSVPRSGFFMGFGTYCEIALQIHTWVCTLRTRIWLCLLLPTKTDISKKVEYVSVV